MLGLVADDLTGAGDASVQFAKRGWDTLLSLALEESASLQESRSRKESGSHDKESGSRGGQSVVAVTTDCRAMSDAAAEALTSRAVSALLGLDIERLFLKIDSTMRGSVRGQVAGALAAWRSRYPDARAVVCPAYPSMGRTVASNRLLVDGEPVERTVFGRDPVTPVNTSDMTQLLPQASHISLMDAATDADLAGIAEMISAIGIPMPPPPVID